MNALSSLIESINSLTPEEQASVREFVDFLKRKDHSSSSSLVSAADEFIRQHPELLQRLAQ